MTKLNIVFANIVQTIEYIILDTPLPSQLIDVILANKLLFLRPLLQLFVRDEFGRKGKLLRDVDQHSVGHDQRHDSTHFDDNSASSNWRRVVGDITFTSTQFLALTVKSNWLPWRINSPYGKRPLNHTKSLLASIKYQIISCVVFQTFKTWP